MNQLTNSGIMIQNDDEVIKMLQPELGVGQIRAFHMLFNQNPILAIIVLLALIALAIYLKNR